MAMFSDWVICGWESGTVMRNVLPSPLALLTLIRPPSSVTRSRMLRSPNLPMRPGSSGLNLRPLSLSDTDNHTCPRRRHEAWKNIQPLLSDHEIMVAAGVSPAPDIDDPQASPLCPVRRSQLLQQDHSINQWTNPPILVDGESTLPRQQ